MVCQVSSTAWQPPASSVGFDQVWGLTAHMGMLSSAFKPAGYSVNSTDSGTGWLPRAPFSFSGRFCWQSCSAWGTQENCSVDTALVTCCALFHPLPLPVLCALCSGGQRDGACCKQSRASFGWDWDRSFVQFNIQRHMGKFGCALSQSDDVWFSVFGPKPLPGWTAKFEWVMGVENVIQEHQTGWWWWDPSSVHLIWALLGASR